SSLELALHNLSKPDMAPVVDRFIRWLKVREQKHGGAQRIIFVADEVGAWAADLKRIEQVRSFVETLADRGKGTIWLIVTSQEKLSAVVANAPFADIRTEQEFLQRLE